MEVLRYRACFIGVGIWVEAFGGKGEEQNESKTVLKTVLTECHISFMIKVAICFLLDLPSLLSQLL